MSNDSYGYLCRAFSKEPDETLIEAVMRAPLSTRNRARNRTRRLLVRSWLRRDAGDRAARVLDKAARLLGATVVSTAGGSDD